MELKVSANELKEVGKKYAPEIFTCVGIVSFIGQIKHAVATTHVGTKRYLILYKETDNEYYRLIKSNQTIGLNCTVIQYVENTENKRIGSGILLGLFLFFFA